MPDRLDEYRRKRDAARTPEPIPEQVRDGRGNTFVIQQHHARSLHWDLRLERDGVLVSWAVPRGVPKDPERDHLAVHTEDHPMEYATFHGEIPAGEYGAGRMTIFDQGTYTTQKWRDNEVMVTLQGERVSGRYVLYRTDSRADGRSGRPGERERSRDWMIHRMDPPPPGWSAMPAVSTPMLATPTDRLPPDDDNWAYELDWPGTRALAAISGGRLELRGTTAKFKEIGELGEWLAPTECLLDGVVVDVGGAQYFPVDLLWLDGTPTLSLPYVDRRDLLTGLSLAGPHWQTPPHFPGGGQFALDAARDQGMRGVIAKRLDSPYVPGEAPGTWLRVTRP